MPTENGNNTYSNNTYFLLDLKLPDPKTLGVKPNNNTSSVKLEKFGFIELLETIHGKDLRTNNPWFNPSTRRVHWYDRFKKQVHFSTTEINSTDAQLPYCRRMYPRVKAGQLHAPTCRNSAQETVEVLGGNAWQNRVFILDAHMQNIQHSLSRLCDTTDNSSSETGEYDYSRARMGSLEENDTFELEAR